MRMWNAAGARGSRDSGSGRLSSVTRWLYSQWI